jgi:hypothetical protein
MLNMKYCDQKENPTKVQLHRPRQQQDLRDSTAISKTASAGATPSRVSGSAASRYTSADVKGGMRAFEERPVIRPACMMYVIISKT